MTTTRDDLDRRIDQLNSDQLAGAAALLDALDAVDALARRTPARLRDLRTSRFVVVHPTMQEASEHQTNAWVEAVTTSLARVIKLPPRTTIRVQPIHASEWQQPTNDPATTGPEQAVRHTPGVSGENSLPCCASTPSF
jgi:hypothetical protein